VKNNIFKTLIFVLILSIALAPSVTSFIHDEMQARENIRIAKEIAEAEKIAAEKLYLTGRFDQTKNPNFVQIDKSITLGGATMYLRKETYGAFLDMRNAAKKDGVDLFIASATRNFSYQKNLWNNKWTGGTLVNGKDLSKTIPDGLERFKKILEYSAVPTTSRHHWGTDIDLNNANVEYFDTTYGQKVYSWLVANAPSYGFCQTYNQKTLGRPTGYNEEKWHWSYLPLAQDFTKRYKELIELSDITGFEGDQYATQADVINNYVLSINPLCL
jgi:LAS superfamily LD-carboxypeptidase LdcB